MDDRAGPPVRLVGVSRGDPHDPLAASGLPYHFFAAVERRYGRIERVDVQLRRRQRPFVALATFHPDPARWRERFYKNRLAFELHSRNSASRLRRLSARPELAIQLHALFQTRTVPYVLELDTTHRLSREAWPEGSPFGERGVRRWYELERRTYLEAEHLFVRGEGVAESLVSFYGVPPDRISVAGGGANLDGMPRPAEGRDGRTILFVGREFRRKGGEVLVEAFRLVRERVPEARLQIVGTAEAPIAPGVEVLGPVGDRGRLSELYSRASVFALPSRFEPYGFAVCEAMAHGLPCVVTSVGGLPDVVVAGETGLVVPPGDVDALADALTLILLDRGKAAALGAAGRRRAERELTWDHVVARMAPVIERVSERLRAGARLPGRMETGAR